MYSSAKQNEIIVLENIWNMSQLSFLLLEKTYNNA